MRAAALLLALLPPLPVTTISGVADPDGSVTIAWTLPVDPSIVGETIIRQRLDVFEPDVEIVLGLDTSFTDFSTVITGSYRYWVYTRDGSGQLSLGVFVDVFSGAQAVVFVNTSGSSFVCWASATTGLSLWPLGLAAALLALAIGVTGKRRRRK